MLGTALKATLAAYQNNKKYIRIDVDDAIARTNSSSSPTSFSMISDKNSAIFLRNANHRHHLDVSYVISLLKQEHRVPSDIVEGGARTLSSFLTLSCDDDSNNANPSTHASFIDCSLITISPN